MSVEKLTQRFVDEVGLSPGQSRGYWWSASLPGLGLVVGEKAKTYVLKYRFEGRQRKLKLGRHPQIKLKKAEELARRAFGQLAEGKDPGAGGRAARHGETMGDLLDRFLSERAGEKKPRTRESYKSLVERHIRPGIGTVRVATLSREACYLLHRKVGKRINPRTKGPTRGAANRMLALLHAIMEFAEEIGWRALNTNPVRHIEPFAEPKSDRSAPPEAFGTVLDALDEAERTGELHWAVCAAIRVIVMTGARPSEIRAAWWSKVDLTPGEEVLVLERHKTDGSIGHKLIELPGPVAEVFRRLPRPQVGDGPVFPSPRNPRKAVQDLAHPFARLRDRIGLPKDITLYSFRHGLATIARDLGYSDPQIQDVYGHTSVRMTKKYGREVRKQKRDVVQAVVEEVTRSADDHEEAGDAQAQ